MKVLVVGSGGREHAIVWKLCQSRHLKELYCAPGNAGIGAEHVRQTGAAVQCEAVNTEDLTGLLALAQRIRPDLTVVGPDNPLAMGIVDLFQQNQFRIWGPNQSAARFESSKAFAQEFMQKYGIPTAQSGIFSAPGEAKAFADKLEGRCAVKADGLALGKGVLICQSPAEAHRAIDEIMVSRSFGSAGTRVVIQEFLDGMEISLHAICDGKTARLFPSSQDHKRALDGDHGLNTGGMGTFSPAPFLTEAELAETGRAILEPWLEGCRSEGIDFRGILYPGVMLTKNGPKVLEFNARFGDPETQVYLPRLETDLLELFEASTFGTLEGLDMRWSAQHAVCVVMASGGYPGSYPKGKVIEGLEAVEAMQGVKVFHAGTAFKDGRVVTNGGRVLGVTAWGEGLLEARNKAYAAVEEIRFEAAHFRRDIGAKALGSVPLL